MNYEFLSRTFLFQGTSPEETKHMLSCLKATPQSYAKGSTIWQVGDQVKTMGLVLNGSVHIENIDMMGNKSILNRIAPGQVFGETYACIPGEKLLIGVTAAEDCQILFLEVGKIFRTCPDTCPCHEKLIHNMLLVMEKNFPEEAFIRHRNPSGEDCFPIFPRRWCSRAAAGLRSPLTGRNWLIILA